VEGGGSYRLLGLNKEGGFWKVKRERKKKESAILNPSKEFAPSHLFVSVDNWGKK